VYIKWIVSNVKSDVMNQPLTQTLRSLFQVLSRVVERSRDGLYNHEFPMHVTAIFCGLGTFFVDLFFQSLFYIFENDIADFSTKQGFISPVGVTCCPTIIQPSTWIVIVSYDAQKAVVV
jgi:hypothetical protein